MASIFGLKLKGRRSFEGMDWQGNQGNLYIDNKKIAWFNDSGNGGPADIEFYGGRPGREQYEPQINEIVKKYYSKYPMTGAYADLTPDAEMLMGELLQLMDDEKQFKKYQKMGYSATAIFKIGENGVTKYCACRGQKGVAVLAKEPNVIIIKVYHSIADFEIK